MSALIIDDGTGITASRLYRRTTDRFYTLDRRLCHMGPDAPERGEVEAAKERAWAEMVCLDCAVFRRQPETVADAAALAAHALYRLETWRDQCPEADMEADLGKVYRALASIATTTATAAGIDLGDIGGGDLPRLVRLAR